MIRYATRVLYFYNLLPYVFIPPWRVQDNKVKFIINLNVFHIFIVEGTVWWNNE